MKNQMNIITADYHNSEHMQDILMVLNAYSKDEMGQGKPLEDSVKKRIAKDLAGQPQFFSLIAYMDNQPCGLANCAYGYSTFAGRRLINIHDLAVLPGYRGKGIGSELLEEVSRIAEAENCCKVTLEVRIDNRARNLYKRHGFGDDDPPLSFWRKKI